MSDTPVIRQYVSIPACDVREGDRIDAGEGFYGGIQQIESAESANDGVFCILGYAGTKFSYREYQPVTVLR